MRNNTERLLALTLCGWLLVSTAPAAIFTGSGTGNIPDPKADGPTNYSGGSLVVSFDVAGLPNKIQNVWLAVTMDHEWIGDLDVFLSSPAGTNFTIFSRVGAFDDVFGTNS